jgi:hypothetical protein
VHVHLAALAAAGLGDVPEAQERRAADLDGRSRIAADFIP